MSPLSASCLEGYTRRDDSWGNGPVPGQSHRPGQGETANGGEEDAGKEETKVMCGDCVHVCS